MIKLVLFCFELIIPKVLGLRIPPHWGPPVLLSNLCKVFVSSKAAAMHSTCLQVMYCCFQTENCISCSLTQICCSSAKLFPKVTHTTDTAPGKNNATGGRFWVNFVRWRMIFILDLLQNGWGHANVDPAKKSVRKCDRLVISFALLLGWTLDSVCFDSSLYQLGQSSLSLKVSFVWISRICFELFWNLVFFLAFLKPFLPF